MTDTTARNRLSPGTIPSAYPRAGVILGAVVADLVIWAISRFLGDVELRANGMTIGPVGIVVVVLGIGLIAWGLLAFLERRTERSWPIWRTIALVVLVLSFIGPIGADNGSARIVLSVMHAVTGAIIIKGFSNTVRR